MLSLRCASPDAGCCSACRWTYQVYLIGRIQEEWRRGGTTGGQAKSGPVIAAAAGIMILVSGSFMFGGARDLAEFGFGLAFSVLADALLIHSLLVPALMHVAGPVNWALPRWLDRILPAGRRRACGSGSVD